MRIKNISILVSALIISTNIYAQNQTDNKNNINYNAAKSIAQTANFIKEAKAETIGLRPEYNKTLPELQLKNKILGELKGCYSIFMGNKELTDKEHNFFQIEKIDPNSKYKPELNKPEQRNQQQQIELCNNFLKKPIELSCIEQIKPWQDVNKKIPEFKGLVINQEHIDTNNKYRDNREKIFKEKIQNYALSSINACYINKEIKQKDIRITFTTERLITYTDGKTQPYVDNMYKDKQMTVTKVTYIPLTKKENKELQIYGLTIKEEDKTTTEKLKEKYQGLLLILALMGFAYLFIKYKGADPF